MFNALPLHAAAVALVHADTALLKHYANTSYTFSAANHPLPQSAKAKTDEEASGNSADSGSVTYPVNVMFGFAFLTASFVMFLIGERSRSVSEVTHANALWDMSVRMMKLIKTRNSCFKLKHIFYCMKLSSEVI